MWAATLDKYEQLPSVSVSANDLALLQGALVKRAPRSECFAEDIAGVLSNKVDAGIMSHLS